MIQFKLATLQDESILLNMAVAFHIEDGHPINEKGASVIRMLLAGSELGKIYLIQKDDNVVGYFALCFTMSLEFGGLVVILDDLYIKPEFRRNGYGSSVLKSIERMAKKWQAVQIFLEVEIANKKAQSLYIKNGFFQRQRLLMDKHI